MILNLIVHKAKSPDYHETMSLNFQKEKVDLHIFDKSKAKKPKDESDLGKPLEDITYKVRYPSLSVYFKHSKVQFTIY